MASKIKILSYNQHHTILVMLVGLLLLPKGLALHPLASISRRRSGRIRLYPPTTFSQRGIASSAAPSPSLPIAALRLKRVQMEQTDTREAEEDRKKMRILYDHKDWVYHRRPGRFMDEFGPPITRICLWFVYFFCLGIIAGTIEIVWPVPPS